MMDPITITAQFDEEDAKRFEKAAKLFPKETYRAIGQVGSTLRSRMRKVTGKAGGMFGVDPMKPHNQFTIFLHGERPIGGQISKPHAIQMYRAGSGKLVVGYVSGITSWAKALQTREVRPTTVKERAMFHRRIGKRKNEIATPATYDRPERNVIEPFVQFHKELIPEWIMGALEKMMLKTLKKAKAQGKWAAMGI